MKEYQTWLVDWFAHRAPNITLEPEDNYFTAGAIDSLGVIELIEDVEQTFSVRFSQDDFQDQRFTNIRRLAEMLKEKSVS